MTNGFKIIGISTRTTNQNNQAQQDIGALWGRFFSENIIEQIPNKVSNRIISVYTDYQSNYTEEYTTIIGVPVASFENIPEGLISREFSADNFQKFVAKGSMPEAVANTWKHIWEKDKDLARKYTYDFEVYDENSQKGKNSEVAIYIAIH